MIELVKSWNYKYSKINEILEELEQFKNKEWKNIKIILLMRRKTYI